jgi:hypothetical protein
MRTLCEALSVRFDLGVKTRKAYREGSRDALEQIVKKDYPAAIRKVQAFYDAFEAFWMVEKKPFGFEVQDIRLGGLKQRLVACRERLLQYANGEIDCIEELEETLVYVEGLLCNDWVKNASINKI